MWLNGVYQSAYAFVSLLLIVRVVRSLKLANDFRFAKCTWGGNSCSEITEFNRTPDEHVSEWPPGPYALPMPVDGCPESRLKGWEQGYIDFTWRDPYAVLTRNISTFEELNDNDTTVDLKDITLVKLTDIQSVIMGPYNRYRIKLNFCFKLRSDSTLDRGEWPDGSYAIYGDITGCSTGFTVEDKLIKLPKTTFWISDGYLPYFKFNRTEENEELRIRLCARSITWSMKSKNGTLPSKEPFVLLNKNKFIHKESPTQCSTDDDMVVREVILYLQPALPDLSNNTALLPLLAVCYYWPVKWSDDFNVLERKSTKHFLEQDFVFTNVYISMGNVSDDSYMFLSRPTEIVYNTISAFSMMATTKIEWTIIDLGRTIPVTAIFVPYEIDVNTFTGVTSIHGQDDSYCLRWEDVVKYDWQTEFTFPDESPKEAGRNCRNPKKFYSKGLFCMNDLRTEVECKVFHWKKANEGFPRCFISDGKWDFLHNSALSCSYKVYYDFTVVPAVYYMQFNRVNINASDDVEGFQQMGYELYVTNSALDTIVFKEYQYPFKTF